MTGQATIGRPVPLFVRLYRGKKRMEVGVEHNGVKRMVVFRWEAKGDSDVPPDHWWGAVLRELDWSDGEKARGWVGGH